MFTFALSALLPHLVEAHEGEVPGAWRTAGTRYVYRLNKHVALTQLF